MLTAGALPVYAFNAGLGWPLLPSAIAGCVVGGIMAVLIDAVVYRRLRDRSGVTLLVASMGVAFVLENAVRFIAGNSPAGYQVDPARPLRVGEHLRINHEQLVVAAVSLVALLAIWALFRLTPLGRAMRAVADNPSLATARGVDANRVIGTTWFIAGVPATAAGTLIGLDATLDPQMGWNYVIQVFAATILGGIAHPMAAVFGALTLGVIAELSTLVLPPHYRPSWRSQFSPCCCWYDHGASSAQLASQNDRLSDLYPRAGVDCRDCRALAQPSMGPDGHGQFRPVRVLHAGCVCVRTIGRNRSVAVAGIGRGDCHQRCRERACQPDLAAAGRRLPSPS